MADNDVSGNSGWGIHLWKSARNVIVRNKADHNVRCESVTYRHGCDSAALLLREQSDSNLVAENDLTWSGDGFFLSGQRSLVSPSIGNMVIRNDASHAWHNGFESTFSSWNTFLENRADSADYGFWLGYSRDNVVRGNLLLGTRTAAIAIEHGAESEIAANTIIGGATGIRLFIRESDDELSQGYRIDDNILAKVERGIVLESTTRVKLRGNLFDGVAEGLVVDSAGSDAEVVGKRVSLRQPLADQCGAAGCRWQFLGASGSRGSAAATQGSSEPAAVPPGPGRRVLINRACWPN